MPYVAPELDKDAFNCPFCDAYATQRWGSMGAGMQMGYWNVADFSVSSCRHCKRDAIWRAGQMIYPARGGVPMPNPDLPEDVRADYEEAAAVIGPSPRASAALLRLCVQNLLKSLGQPGQDLNREIGDLVKDGLPVRVQQALDLVRVVGNNAVHPGELDLRDDHSTATKMFDLLNIVANHMISEPKAVQALFEDTIPAGAKESVQRRDKAVKE